MDVREESRIDFRYIKQLALLALILTSFVFLVLTIHSWEELRNLQLGDNDDYMRYYQFTSWIQEGNWYLQPIDNFNPEHGQIIHWSRLPDIPLAAVTLVLKSLVGQQTAEILAMIVVPFIYLVSLCTAVSFFTYRLAGPDAAKLALCMVVLSPLITKFNPGSIDHHNIQLALVAWVIALLPLNKQQAKSKFICWLHGLLIGLSLWVGMENLPIIAILLFLMTICGYANSKHYLLYCNKVCISSCIFTLLFIILNRPISEIFVARFDAISYMCIVLLFSGFTFCSLSIVCFKNERVRRINSAVIYTLIAIISVIPLLTIIPLLYSGLFFNYPDKLQIFWLDHVIEARSIFNIVREGGLFDKHNFLIFIIPSIISIILIYKRKDMFFLYVVFMVLLTLPLFWQVRTIFSVLLFAIPLQAVLCDILMMGNKNQTQRILILLVCMPITPTLITKTIPNYINSFTYENIAEDNELKNDVSSLSKIDILKGNDIDNSIILAPTEYGAPILALTNNKIIAAPYHRNIDGNTLMVEIFSSTSSDYVRKAVGKYEFEYIMIGSDAGTNILLSKSENGSFIHRLNEKHIPQWLSLIEESSSGVKLYKVNRDVL